MGALVEWPRASFTQGLGGPPSTAGESVWTPDGAAGRGRVRATQVPPSSRVHHRVLLILADGATCTGRKRQVERFSPVGHSKFLPCSPFELAYDALMGRVKWVAIDEFSNKDPLLVFTFSPFEAYEPRLWAN